MGRSLFNHSLLFVAGLAGMISCSSESGTGTGSSNASDSAASGSSGTSGAGGHGGGATSASSSASSSSASGAGGAAGSGGAGGGTGGAGGGTGGAGGGVPEIDQDGDGWTVSEGDCCDTPGTCGSPALVNPGAFEYLGNGVDDDCDPTTPDTVLVPDCSPGPLVVPTESDDLIRAMDLCQYTKEDAPKPQKKWGVISSQILLADGSPHPNSDTINNVQIAVLDNYGPSVSPQKGLTMAALSSGTARRPGDPAYVHPQNGAPGQIGNYNANTSVGVPSDYLTSHNGSLPSPTNCPACSGPECTTAFDSVNLKAKIRVPTNALSFSYRFKFYTAEYPEFVCQKFNDFFLALLSSQALGLPADKNIAFDAQKSPVSVNNGFFEVCFALKPGDCPGGTLELVGTGMGGWDNNLKDGGGTEWLTNEAPVKPGETIDLQFIVWDAGDHNVDSLVLLDKFRWSITPSPVGTHK